MAEIILRNRLKKEAIDVTSAGLMAMVDQPAAALAIKLLDERGLDATIHQARQITTEIAQSAELILVMEQWQKQKLERNIPQIKGRVFRLGHWQNLDIVDPYRHDREVFEQSLTTIEKGINNWIEKL